MSEIEPQWNRCVVRKETTDWVTERRARIERENAETVWVHIVLGLA